MGWVITFFCCCCFSSPLSPTHTPELRSSVPVLGGFCNLLLENGPALTFGLANVLPSLPLNPPVLSSLPKCMS